MKGKRYLALVLTLLLSILSFAACSGGQEETEAEPAPEEETEAELLSDDELLNAVFDDLGVSLTMASEIKIGAVQDDNTRMITFKLNGQECAYVIDAYTGAIESKDVPDGAVEAAESAGDPMEQAINASFNTIDGYKGGAENIAVSQDGTDIIVQFDYNGEHYQFRYDANTKEAVRE